MNKRIVVLAASFMALAAVAQQDRRPDRQVIDVQVINGRIVVPEEVAETNEREGALVWRLVEPGYAFPENGIVVDSKGKHRCRVNPENERRFRCAKLRHDPGERYKYVVNVIDTRSQQPLEPLDPYIQNN